MTDVTVPEAGPEPVDGTVDEEPGPGETSGPTPVVESPGHFHIDEQVELELPLRSRIILVSDIHLPAVATSTSTAVADEIADVLGKCHGPGAFVIAGDGFEMLAGPPDVGMILDAHPQFTQAVVKFSSAADHHVIVLSGNHDGQLAWDGGSVRPLKERLGVEVFALNCDLVLDTEAGPQRVRVVHGNQSDPYNTFEDPWSPVDTPSATTWSATCCPSSSRASPRAPSSRGCSGSTGRRPTSWARASSTGRSSASCGWWPSLSWPSCFSGCSPSSPACGASSTITPNAGCSDSGSSWPSWSSWPRWPRWRRCYG